MALLLVVVYEKRVDVELHLFVVGNDVIQLLRQHVIALVYILEKLFSQKQSVRTVLYSYSTYDDTVRHVQDSFD